MQHFSMVTNPLTPAAHWRCTLPGTHISAWSQTLWHQQHTGDVHCQEHTFQRGHKPFSQQQHYGEVLYTPPRNTQHFSMVTNLPTAAASTLVMYYTLLGPYNISAWLHPPPPGPSQQQYCGDVLYTPRNTQHFSMVTNSLTPAAHWRCTTHS